MHRCVLILFETGIIFKPSEWITDRICRAGAVLPTRDYQQFCRCHEMHEIDSDQSPSREEHGRATPHCITCSRGRVGRIPIFFEWRYMFSRFCLKEHCAANFCFKISILTICRSHVVKMFS